MPSHLPMCHVRMPEGSLTLELFITSSNSRNSEIEGPKSEDTEGEGLGGGAPPFSKKRRTQTLGTWEDVSVAEDSHSQSIEWVTLALRGCPLCARCCCAPHGARCCYNPQGHTAGDLQSQDSCPAVWG